MKINKQLFYRISILIIYYLLFLSSIILPISANEKNKPTYTATFILFVSIYLLTFKNKKSLFFYSISLILIPLLFIFSGAICDEIMKLAFFEIPWVFYIYQNMLFLISYFFLLAYINKLLKKPEASTDNKNIFIKGKDYVSVVIIMFIGIASIYFSINNFNNISNQYELIKEYESMIPDTVFVAAHRMDLHEGQGDYEEEGEESNEEEISTYSLASLWDKPEDDKKNIEDAMLFLIDKNLSTDGQGNLYQLKDDLADFIYLCPNVYNLYNCNQRLIDKYERHDSLQINHFVEIKNEIGNDPIKMKSVFNSYKYMFYGLMPKRIYSNTDLENMVNILILSYQDLNVKNSDNNLIKVQEISNSEYDYYDKTDMVEKYISEEYMSEYKKIYYGDGSRIRYGDLYWAYTFWARRYDEKNIKEVYEILTEVQNHYSE
ncbi:hypothetical protein [uncultured Cytophaga sp.]|uniref:hypothetical protein n=1 Tax=uncultured Cytophaga sp. TaxID=160238 RepID=UPI0026275397|nr:hypothetical protein [uncultured Cytophaga sp.]